MKIAVILPNTMLFGGVRRFLELGNRFVAAGEQFIVFTPQGQAPDWMGFSGEVKSFSDISQYSVDVVFFTESKFLPQVMQLSAMRRILYNVTSKMNLDEVIKEESIEYFANSTDSWNFLSRRYGKEAFKAFGGIDLAACRHGESVASEDSFNILTYGRLSRINKGTGLVIRACELLYLRHKNIKLILFDTPIDEKSRELIDAFRCRVPHEFIVNHPVERNSELYARANVFASAEKRAGWSNTCAEAMCAGVPVVASRNGTKDFLFHRKTGMLVRRNPFSIAYAISRLMNDTQLATKLSQNAKQEIEKYDWESLSVTILNNLRSAK